MRQFIKSLFKRKQKMRYVYIDLQGRVDVRGANQSYEVINDITPMKDPRIFYIILDSVVQHQVKRNIYSQVLTTLP